MKNLAPTLVDLFCGAGGMSHGFEQAGFRIIAGVDFDADSVNTFRANHQGARGLQANLSKITPVQLASDLDVTPGSIDCIAGGPPCQGFSRNRAFRHHNGAFVDDPRNHLYWHFFEYIGYLRPKVVVMENVPEILIKSNGFFKEAVFERFHKLGYQVDARVINASEYGVPQWRRRAFFLASRDGGRVSFPDPTTNLGARPGRRTPNSVDIIRAKKAPPPPPPSLFDQFNPTYLLSQGQANRGEWPSVWDAIGDLFGEYALTLDGSANYASPPSTPYQEARRGDNLRVENHFPWKLSERQLQRIRLLGQGQGLQHLPVELQPKNGYGSAYRRLQADAQALTLTTWLFHPGSGMFTHPVEDRVLTIREAARLQSYQDKFVFTGRYHSQCRQLGNSVAPLMARVIAYHLVGMLGDRGQKQDPDLDDSLAKKVLTVA